MFDVKSLNAKSLAEGDKRIIFWIFTWHMIHGESDTNATTYEISGVKYPMLSYVNANELVANTLRGGLTYADFTLRLMNPLLVPAYPLALSRSILCRGTVCVGVDHKVDVEFLETFVQSDKLLYFVALNYLGYSEDGMVFFEDTKTYELNIDNEKREKAKKILEVMKETTTDKTNEAYNAYVKDKRRHTIGYGSLFTKMAEKLGVSIDSLSLIGIEPFMSSKNEGNTSS